MSKVLIIEDHDGIRENIIEILEMALYTVVEAKNGKIGVEMALKHLPDVILCDIMMPELDGYGVLYMLNKHTETSGIPFIFLTAKSERSELRKGMEMGADDYLTKPFGDMELLNAIEIRLSKRAAMKTEARSTADEFRALVAKTDGLEEFNKIILGNKSREIKKNHVIYYETDYGRGLYLIIQGKIKTIKLSNDGRELMTGMYSSGDFVGINAILSKTAYTDTATATEDSLICLITSEQMDNVLNLYPEVARKFIQLLSRDNQEKEEQLLQMAYCSVRKKMAGTLLRLHQKEISKNGCINITREDLAAMSCMAAETVSRTLSDFSQERLIERSGTLITVLDYDKLFKMKN